MEKKNIQKRVGTSIFEKTPRYFRPYSQANQRNPCVMNGTRRHFRTAIKWLSTYRSLLSFRGCPLSGRMNSQSQTWRIWLSHRKTGTAVVLGLNLEKVSSRDGVPTGRLNSNVAAMLPSLSGKNLTGAEKGATVFQRPGELSFRNALP